MKKLYTLVFALAIAGAKISQSQSLSAGGSYSLFVCNDSTVNTWGYNAYGQLGDGTTVNKTIPQQILLSDITAVAGGSQHSLFLKNDGTAWASGTGTFGVLGDGMNTDAITPVQVSLTGITAVAAGNLHSLFLRNDSTVWASGWNTYGQLGDGSTSNRLTPVQVSGLSGIVAIAAGYGHSLFLKNDGTVWACGYNYSGQLGDSTSNNNRTTPVQVYDLSGVTAIAAGQFHSLFVKNDGTAWACGGNSFGQLGDGTTTGKIIPVQITTLSGVTKVSSIADFSLFLKNDGTAWGCGVNNDGQLGDGTTNSSSTPVQVSSLTGITSIAAGNQHSLFAKYDGTVWACGTDVNGQLGNGPQSNSSVPVQVINLCTGFSYSAIQSQFISAGDRHSIFICADSTVNVCGGVNYSQLGGGGSLTTNQLTPVQNGLSGITTTVAGGEHSLFLKSDGTVVGCGRNDYGQLGDGTNATTATPVQAGNLTGIIAMDAGMNHSLFLKADGSVWAAGENSTGKFGNGTNTNSTTPIQVTGLTNIVAVSAGGQHSLFLKNNGTVWASGLNTFGQLGDSTNTDKNSPVQVSGLSGIIAIAAGGNGGSHSLFLKNDGTVWACGNNNYGQLGDGTTTSKNAPVQVVGLSGISSVAAGNGHSLFLKNDGTAWVCGYNSNGQLGDSTLANKSTPVQVNGLAGIIAVADGYHHSFFEKNDGSVWACGLNNNGQLGDGTTVDKTVPVAVTGLCVPPLTADFSSDTTTVCPETCIGFTDSSSNNPTSWSWSFPGGVPATSTSQNPSGICYNTAGIYSVTLIVTNAFGSDTMVKTNYITVNAAPNASVTAGGATTFCEGDSVTLTASGGVTYLWSSGATTAAITAATSGSYTVTATNGNGCPAVAAPVTVTVNPLPTATITPAGPTSFCQGDSVDLTANNASSYLWSDGDTTNKIVVGNSGSFSVTITDVNGCSAASAATTVTVFANPAISISSTDATCNGCSDGLANLTASGGALPYSYLWSNSAITEDISSLAAGTYSVTVTDANNCTATGSVTITQPVTCNANAVLPVTESFQDSLFPPANWIINNPGNDITWVKSNAAGGFGLSSSSILISNYNDTVIGATDEIISQVFDLSADTAWITFNVAYAKYDASYFDQLKVFVSTNCGSTWTEIYAKSGTALATAPDNINLFVPTSVQWRKDSVSLFSFLGQAAVQVKFQNICGYGNNLYLDDISIQKGSQLPGGSDMGFVIGTSTYDLQTNSSGMPRLNYYPNGTLSACWTFSNSGDLASPDRGTGYNFYNGSVWGTPPTTRIETVRTGWPSVLKTGDNREHVISHQSGGLNHASRNGVGSGTWSDAQISGIAASIWPKAVSNGSDTTIHMIAMTLPVSFGGTIYNGMDGALLYYRSTNGGTTWDISDVQLPGTDTSQYTAFTGDAYAIDARGNTVAVIVLDALGDVKLIKSTNNGQTWTTTNVFDFPVNKYNPDGNILDINGDMVPDTVDATDRSGSVYIDNNNKAHVFFGKTRIMDADSSAGNPNFSFFPGLGEVHYWNENMSPNTSVQVGGMPDENNNGVIDLFGNILLYSGITTGASMPSAGGDDNGNLYCIYSAITEADHNGVNNYRHIYAVKSTDNGQSWTSPKDITPFTGKECVFPSLAKLTADSIRLIYQRDDGPGIAVSNNQHPFQTNEIVYLAYDTDDITSPAPDSLLVSVTTTAACGGSANGTATANASGAAPYTYLWSNGQTTQTATGLIAGNYSVTVNDAASNTATATATVNSSGGPGVTVTTVNATCGNNNGSATATASGGATPYSYLWSNGQTTATITGLAAGSYSVTVSDASSCAGDDSASVFSTSAPSVTITSTDASCAGCSDGSVTASVTGGTAPYSYLWSSGDTTATINGKSAGTYSVTVTDANSCAVMDSAVIGQPLCNLSIASVSQTNVSCNGGNNGSASVIVTGGSAPYIYLWSNGQANSTATGLAAGAYSVTISDTSGCSDTAMFTITQPSAITVLVTFTNPACNTNSGSAAASVTGGTSPYSFQWNSGDLTATADSLTSGLYFVTVTDTNGCVKTALTTLSDAGSPVIAISSATDVSCSGGGNGAINISVSGGISPYSYLWSEGSVTEDISSLSAGPYEVEVSGNNGCKSTQSISISEPAPLSVSFSMTDAACGNSDGSITAAPAGGTSPFAYSWSNGGNTAAINNLAAGIYILTATDNNGCIHTAQAAVSESGAASIMVDSVISAGCNGSGGIYVSISGGSIPYSYQWTDNSTSEDLTGASSGSYGLFVTSGNGCVSTVVSSIPFITPVSDPICLVTVDTITGTNKVIWEKTSGQGMASYKIYRETSQAGVYQPVGTVPFDSLSAFTDPVANPLIRSWRYKISAIDSCGNESARSDEHKTIHLTVNLGLSNTINLIWDHYQGFAFTTYYIYRYKPQTGWIVLDSLPNNLTSYTDFSPPTFYGLQYVIEARPLDDCLATKVENHNSSRSNKTSLAPPPVDLTATSTVIDVTQGNCDGSAAITPAGGIAPYSYTWDDPNAQASATATGLCQGTYNCTITDTEGDTAIITVVVGVQIGIAENVVGVFRIYPNPNKGEFIIEIQSPPGKLQNTKITITNILGETVYQNSPGPGLSQMAVDLSHCASGIYYLQFVANNTLFMKKIILE